MERNAAFKCHCQIAKLNSCSMILIRNRGWNLSLVVQQTYHHQNMVQIDHFHSCIRCYRNFHFLDRYFSMLDKLFHLVAQVLLIHFYTIHIIWVKQYNLKLKRRYRENRVPLGDSVDVVSLTVQTISDWKCIFVALVASIAQLKSKIITGLSGQTQRPSPAVLTIQILDQHHLYL